MSAALAGYFTALKRTRIAANMVAVRALETASAELRMDEDGASVPDLHRAEHELAFAARELVDAVDELPRERKPKGWDR